jgi:hypothetical protein
MPAYLTPRHADELAADSTPITPIDTFTARWDRYGQLLAANTHKYINDAPGGCTWPLRRKTLDPRPDSSDESDDGDSDDGDSDDGDSEEEYYGDDEHDKLPCTKFTKHGDDGDADGEDLVSQSTENSNTITGDTDALSDDASIKHWLDAQPTTWLHDRDEILSSADFRICHAEEDDPYTLRMLYLRATAPGRRRSSSVVTVLRVDERGRVWDLDEDDCLVCAGRISNEIDVDGMTAEQLGQQKYTIPEDVERSAPAPKFRLKKKCTDAGTCPKYKMAQNMRSLEERLGQLSLKDAPSLEERLARLSLRDRPRKEER